MCHAYQNYVNLNMPDSGTRKEYLTTGLKDFEKAYSYLEEATDLRDSIAETSSMQNIYILSFIGIFLIVLASVTPRVTDHPNGPLIKHR